ncbi:hypothetical protein PGT21_022640 [Puccinia graminis f. sp. tritici]|uniref:Uncharacterized protein n=1 Tax=Puccinia graminis f. sp. tritici TaxID=56615 RepID=A0A5B0N7Z1_PUCGR|nr:hypothetical protein PGT21_022640 [Puccinia graminis f. sp. tritici]KAA1092356.1 hypothetical protein PGTUg99_022662 [Puccinia graminis f. sp. tritici]
MKLGRLRNVWHLRFCFWAASHGMDSHSTSLNTLSFGSAAVMHQARHHTFNRNDASWDKMFFSRDHKVPRDSLVSHCTNYLASIRTEDEMPLILAGIPAGKRQLAQNTRWVRQADDDMASVRLNF